MVRGDGDGAPLCDTMPTVALGSSTARKRHAASSTAASAIHCQRAVGCAPATTPGDRAVVPSAAGSNPRKQPNEPLPQGKRSAATHWKLTHWHGPSFLPATAARQCHSSPRESSLMMTRKRPDFPAGPAAQRATTWLCLAAAGACVGKALVLPPPAPVSASPSAAHAERGGGASATACGLTFALAATNRVYGDDGSPNRTAILGAGFAHSTSNKACATEASDGNVAPLAAGVWKCAANAWEGYSATTLPVFQHGTDALGAADAILRAQTRHSRAESAGDQPSNKDVTPQWIRPSGGTREGSQTNVACLVLTVVVAAAWLAVLALLPVVLLSE